MSSSTACGSPSAPEAVPTQPAVPVASNAKPKMAKRLRPSCSNAESTFVELQRKIHIGAGGLHGLASSRPKLDAVSTLLQADKPSLPPGTVPSVAFDIGQLHNLVKQCLLNLAKEGAAASASTDSIAHIGELAADENRASRREGGWGVRAFRTHFHRLHEQLCGLWTAHKEMVEDLIAQDAEDHRTREAALASLVGQIAQLEARLADKKQRLQELEQVCAAYQRNATFVEEASEHLQALDSANRECGAYYDAWHHQRTVVAAEDETAAHQLAERFGERPRTQATVQVTNTANVAVVSGDHLQRYVQLVSGRPMVQPELLQAAHNACAVLAEVVSNPAVNGLCHVSNTFSTQVCAAVCAIAANLHHEQSRVAVLDACVQPSRPPGFVVSKLNPKGLHAAYYCTSVHEAAGTELHDDACLCVPDVSVRLPAARALQAPTQPGWRGSQLFPGCLG